MTREEELRSRLLPPGTRLADVPPDWRGLTDAEWMELRILESKAALRLLSPAPTPRIATSRDNYGWRSLQTKTHYFPK